MHVNIFNFFLVYCTLLSQELKLMKWKKKRLIFSRVSCSVYVNMTLLIHKHIGLLLSLFLVTTWHLSAFITPEYKVVLFNFVDDFSCMH